MNQQLSGELDKMYEHTTNDRDSVVSKVVSVRAAQTDGGNPSTELVNIIMY